jgi:hypothetical protein
MMLTRQCSSLPRHRPAAISAAVITHRATLARSVSRARHHTAEHLTQPADIGCTRSRTICGSAGTDSLAVSATAAAATQQHQCSSSCLAHCASMPHTSSVDESRKELRESIYAAVLRCQYKVQHASSSACAVLSILVKCKVFTPDTTFTA